ncbi:hypothetical protein TRIUR3_29322 [Triticum urartu]|uniref:Uncharacterized protein n=1 Tax=Triticum urartu TaxID=4572 RepID=M7YV51_TRIUA|nr:hypothetical protein TRIUR3_29322 [Triticum urartu]
MAAEGHLAPEPLPPSVRSQARRRCHTALPYLRRSGRCIFFTSFPSPCNSPDSRRPLPVVSAVLVHLRVLLPLTPSRTNNEQGVAPSTIIEDFVKHALFSPNTTSQAPTTTAALQEFLFDKFYDALVQLHY